ncbi:hypothetical protein QCN32_gp43 [Arthrobacter phage Niktson]|uniref:Uncharacterized protein n=1 Tax=Arthrobacter phage Niktson TaxID=2014347 RepID=A0A218M5R0_9CAUD|nr:hypothetical protein QCN32_gp43 [Arthrobacter phage Niktson]ASD52318.1 hypothetical protein NIKTSON_43 [Arthrobacter phage Niktson]ASD52404.1 hypothetical protein ELEPHANTMAN_43 [Arthrobacter phage ElephantMan]
MPLCPECRDGKHQNCTGQALHPVSDEIVACNCPTCEPTKEKP